MSWQVIRGDCVERMRELDECSVDAVVCDPPYGLEFMGKKWDRLTDHVGSVSHAGFAEEPGFKGFRLASYSGSANMKCRRCNKWTYDHEGRKCECPTPDVDRAAQPRLMQDWHQAWATEALRVLKPGGHLLAFGGTRTYHRLACAVEDAGFEIRDTICWMYGSGFPKSLDVSKAIDRLNGKPLDKLREFGAYVRSCREAAGLTQAEVNRAMEMPQGCGWWEGKGAGGKWDLHPPSVETWARLKPLIAAGDEWDWFIEWAEAEREKVATGASGATAGMQALGPSGIAGGEFDITAPATPEAQQWSGWGTALKPAFEPVVVARKPLSGTVAACVLEHGTGALNVDGCRIETAPEDLVAMQGRSGARTAGEVFPSRGDGEAWEPTAAGRWPANCVLDPEAARLLDEQTGELPAGTAVNRNRALGEHSGNRIYGERANGSLDDITYGDSGGASRFFYCAKASRGERNAGLEGFEEKAKPVQIQQSEGRQLAGQAESMPTRNPHPTVKPIDLMRWLVRLVTPPGGTVLDPFTGSGTTGCAAVLEGFDFVGIEREDEYAAIAEARIGWWEKHRGEGDADEILAAGVERDQREQGGQMSMEAA